MAGLGLPTNIDATHQDDPLDDSDAEHRQMHDTVNEWINVHSDPDANDDPHGDRAAAAAAAATEIAAAVAPRVRTKIWDGTALVDPPTELLNYVTPASVNPTTLPGWVEANGHTWNRVPG